MNKFFMLSLIATATLSSTSVFANEYLSNLEILSDSGGDINHVTHNQTVMLKYTYTDSDSTAPTSRVTTKIYVDNELAKTLSFSSNSDHYTTMGHYTVPEKYQYDGTFKFCAIIDGIASSEKCIDLPFYGQSK